MSLQKVDCQPLLKGSNFDLETWMMTRRVLQSKKFAFQPEFSQTSPQYWSQEEVRVLGRIKWLWSPFGCTWEDQSSPSYPEQLPDDEDTSNKIKGVGAAVGRAIKQEAIRANWLSTNQPSNLNKNLVIDLFSLGPARVQMPVDPRHSPKISG
ncbi:hypothetical protein PGTUg99_023521 [Puccinia graminis f. sp. tritici]|uniref:Uncharacterized protein n=1 Tax=Puccinia graminis f. sp. tritici TaxID=56615 RepID=A0A5B0RNA1_PUCGR|nr:hypothetical protein PGTUg99_023521 [Puccinia graminis f. sp. tritici]